MQKLFILVFLLSIEGLGPKIWGQDQISTDTFLQGVKWRSIGPFRGGRSVAASGVVGNPLTYYMGTTGGGLWKTDDAGQHWTNISDGFFKTGSVGAVAVSESDPNVVYCGMGEHAVRGVMTHHGDGLYKSSNGGKTWHHMGLGQTQHIAEIRIHPKNPDILYVAAQGPLYGPSDQRGIFRSKDGGVTWEKILYVDENTGCTDLDMLVDNPDVLYAAMWEHGRKPWKVISGGPGSGLYKSTDGGDSWRKIHNGLPRELGKMAVSACRTEPDRVYALIESDSDQEKGGLFVSDDAGKKWTRISKDHRLVQRAWYYIEVFADPNDKETVYVLSAPALRSIDGGKSWERLSGTHGDFHDLWINPQNSKNMVIANDGGAAISFNYGKTWSTQGNMPTAQFYRVNVDNQFPYHLYGGQQDNSSVKIASRALNGGLITEHHWTYSAGGESAFLAFDPDDPRYVLGGSYLGTIEVLDARAEAGTDIMAAPIQYLGRDAKDMKYRYNWNAPIIWSQHEPNTFYHAAQYLLRTRDMGQTWEEVSPDLTRNEKEKQGKGGGPYTNEAVGAENYGTISYVVESQHERGVLWVGSDDGLVHLTRDGGEHWQNVTPQNLEECLINAIDVSPHDPGTAYIATTRYKFNEHTPALYKTSDYGNSWKNITGNISQGAFTRVVREDPGQKGLLIAGTETGIYWSKNDGIDWQSLQLNLPIAPITDLLIKHDDVIVATSGRSFWILDDLELLRQLDDDLDQVHLFRPASGLLVNGSSQLDQTKADFKGSSPYGGINPANGVLIYYHLPETLDSAKLTLSIIDEKGEIIRSFSSQKDTTFTAWDGGPPTEAILPAKKGLNRFVWDMRHATMPGIPGVYIEANYRGHKVIPGTYGLKLEANESILETSVEIDDHPIYPTDLETYQTYNAYMSEMEGSLTEMHDIVNRLFKIHQQIAATQSRLGNDQKELMDAGTQLMLKLKKWDEEMVQRKSKAYDDVENFPNKFTADYLFLINQTESDIPRVTEASRELRKEFDAIWSEKRTESQRLLQEIKAYNEKLWQAGIGALSVEVDRS